MLSVSLMEGRVNLFVGIVEACVRRATLVCIHHPSQNSMERLFARHWGLGFGGVVFEMTWPT